MKAFRIAMTPADTYTIIKIYIDCGILASMSAARSGRYVARTGTYLSHTLQADSPIISYCFHKYKKERSGGSPPLSAEEICSGKWFPIVPPSGHSYTPYSPTAPARPPCRCGIPATRPNEYTLFVAQVSNFLDSHKSSFPRICTYFHLCRPRK
jgi:hypothetical protein